MIPSADPPDLPDPADPVHGLPLGTSPTRAGGQDDVSSKQTPSNNSEIGGAMHGLPIQNPSQTRFFVAKGDKRDKSSEGRQE